MSKARHVLVNALSVGGGGGVTVARELSKHLALQRSDWTITIAVDCSNRLHREFEQGLCGANLRVHACDGISGVWSRARYERSSLASWVAKHDVDAVLQLNGMVVPGMPVPTLAHCQNPFPYQPIAWDGWRDRVESLFKRREQGRSLPSAACVGWTSGYLRDLVCERLRLKPRRDEIFHNGLADEWLDGKDDNRTPLENRPLEILTVSNVAPYKRQTLAIRAMGLLVKRAGLESLVYRIVGDIPPGYRMVLTKLAHSLGLGERVVIEGRIDPRAVAERYQRPKCFVFMSVCESFGIPVIEAMASGTPVIAANICALPEICRGAAELIEPDDVARLADSIYAVLNDPSRARELRRRGFANVQRFRWSETAAKMAKALDEIIEGRTASPRASL